jgi:hypothetical protein
MIRFKLLLVFNFLIALSCLSQTEWTEKDQKAFEKAAEVWREKYTSIPFEGNEFKNGSGFFDFSRQYNFSSYGNRIDGGAKEYDAALGINSPNENYNYSSIRFQPTAKTLEFLDKKILPLAEKGNVQCIMLLLSQSFWSTKARVDNDMALKVDAANAGELLLRNVKEKNKDERDSKICIWAILEILDMKIESVQMLSEIIESFSEEDINSLRNQFEGDSKSTGRLGILEYDFLNSDNSVLNLPDFQIKLIVSSQFEFNVDRLKFKSLKYYQTILNKYYYLAEKAAWFHCAKCSRTNIGSNTLSFYILDSLGTVSLEGVANDLMNSRNYLKISPDFLSQSFSVSVKLNNMNSAKKFAKMYDEVTKSKSDLAIAKAYYNMKFGDGWEQEKYEEKSILTQSGCDSLKKYLNNALRSDKSGDAHFFAGVAFSNCNCYQKDDAKTWSFYSKAYAMGNQESKVLFDDLATNPKSRVSQKIVNFYGQTPRNSWNGQIECERCKKLYYAKPKLCDQVFQVSLQKSDAIDPTPSSFEQAYLVIQNDFVSGYWCSKNCADDGSNAKRNAAVLEKIKFDAKEIPCAYCSKRASRNSMIPIYEVDCRESVLAIYLNPFVEVDDKYRVCSRKCEHEYGKILCKKNGQLPIID